jgi:hypothetical protein
MSYYIKIDNTNDNLVTNEINSILYDSLAQHEKDQFGEAHFVETIPEVPFIAGKAGNKHFNPVTQTFTFSYQDKPLTQQEEFEILKQENAQLKSDLATYGEAIDFIIMNMMP